MSNHSNIIQKKYFDFIIQLSGSPFCVFLLSRSCSDLEAIFHTHRQRDNPEDVPRNNVLGYD